MNFINNILSGAQLLMFGLSQQQMSNNGIHPAFNSQTISTPLQQQFDPKQCSLVQSLQKQQPNETSPELLNTSNRPNSAYQQQLVIQQLIINQQQKLINQLLIQETQKNQSQPDYLPPQDYPNYQNQFLQKGQVMSYPQQQMQAVQGSNIIPQDNSYFQGQMQTKIEDYGNTFPPKTNPIEQDKYIMNQAPYQQNNQQPQLYQKQQIVQQQFQQPKQQVYQQQRVASQCDQDSFSLTKLCASVAKQTNSDLGKNIAAKQKDKTKPGSEEEDQSSQLQDKAQQQNLQSNTLPNPSTYQAVPQNNNEQLQEDDLNMSESSQTNNYENEVSGLEENSNNKQKICILLKKKIKKINNVCGHQDREHYAKGMCSNCYHKYGRLKKPFRCPHEKLYAQGLCQNCYINSYNYKRRLEQGQKY